jgi:glycosyltransferase involved in cell wall biosynthesis
MKILRIIARLNVGGPARHVVWLTDAMREGEFETTLVAGTVPEGEEDMAYFAARHNVKPLYIKEMSREPSPKDAVSLIKVYRTMLRERPDIVHTHTAKAGTVGRAAAFLYKWVTPGTLIGRPRKVRVVHTFHGHVFHSYYGRSKTRLFILIERALARFATDRIITITKQQFDEINGQVRVGRADQFEVVPLGIDLSAYEDDGSKRAAFRGEVNASDGEFLIGFAGRLTEIKNVPLLLEAAAEYFNSPEVPPTRFIIAGDGHLRGSLEKEAKDLGISERVVFLGNREDPDVVYAGLDLVALTSLNEGTPLSLIEAMASGRPVISTAVGGVVDLLGDTRETHDGFAICERGISTASGDATGFAKGLIYLAKNERLRFGLAENGRDFVNKIYSKERLIEDIRSLYRRLV